MFVELFDQFNMLLTNGLAWGVVFFLMLASGIGNVYQHIKAGRYREALAEAEITGKNFVDIIAKIKSGADGTKILENQSQQQQSTRNDSQKNDN